MLLTIDTEHKPLIDAGYITRRALQGQIRPLKKPYKFPPIPACCMHEILDNWSNVNARSGSIPPLAGRHEISQRRIAMIHKLTPLYLDRLNSQKNWTLFFAYLIAAAFGAILLQQFGARVLLVCALALASAALFHWNQSRQYKIARKEAGQVQLEINDKHLIYRNSLGEQCLLLSQLQVVSQRSEFAPIKLVFAQGKTLILDGFDNTELLVAELRKHAEN